MNVNQKSMLEVSIELITKKKKPQKATEIIKETLELKGLDDTDGTLATQLYIDITTSALFVYCGEGEWDLKSRHDIALWDKDGSYFSDGIIEEDEEDEVTADDYEVIEEEDEIVEVEEDEDDEIVPVMEDEEDDIVDVDDTFIPYSKDYDDETMSDSFLDEDKYNDYMDDYEDLYDDK
ncbi:MAG: DNA-directed RNA polymerase subunit delta [bacterium]